MYIYAHIGIIGCVITIDSMHNISIITTTTTTIHIYIYIYIYITNTWRCADAA